MCNIDSILKKKAKEIGLIHKRSEEGRNMFYKEKWHKIYNDGPITILTYNNDALNWLKEYKREKERGNRWI